jgi:hypothetical protein
MKQAGPLMQGDSIPSIIMNTPEQIALPGSTGLLFALRELLPTATHSALALVKHLGVG